MYSIFVFYHKLFWITYMMYVRELEIVYVNPVGRGFFATKDAARGRYEKNNDVCSGSRLAPCAVVL